MTGGGVGDPTRLRMPARTAAAAVATSTPPGDAHAGEMLMAEDCPNVLLSLHCFIRLCVLAERLRVVRLLVET